MRIPVLAVALFVSFSSSAQLTPPYATSFEGAVGTLNTNFPEGWTWEDLNTISFGNQGWQIIKNSANAQNARTDSTAAHMFSHSSQTNDDWLYMPGMLLEAGAPYQIRFWYSRAFSFPSTEKLALHVGSDAMSTAMGEALWQNTNITSGAYQQANVTFIAPADGIHYFGFHYFSEEFQFILLLDDVDILPITVGVDEAESKPVRMWISGEMLHVATASGEPGMMQVMDASGRTVLQEKVSGTATSVDLSGIPAGVLLARFVAADGAATVRRVVLTR